MTTYSIIAAVSKNGVIGKDDGIPWRMPSDMLRFKELTTYKPLVVGHGTYKTLPKILPKRAIVIYSRRERSRVVPVGLDRIFATNNLEEIIPHITKELPLISCEEFMIGGGAGVYTEFEDIANRMYITEVQAEVEGDTFFPNFDMSRWKLVQELQIERQAKDEYDSIFRTYERSL